MNDPYPDQMPLYVAGQLSADERAGLEKHLPGCPGCQAELALWRALASEIRTSGASVMAPADLAERAISRIHTPSSLRRALRSAWSLLHAQAYLVRSDLWPASAAVMLLGASVALLADQAVVITFLAPLMAAAGLATLYGPHNDPASELTLATPTSPWKILLARLALVSGYDLLLTLAASLILLVIVPVELLGALILTWLGPLAFLSALALLLSIWIGTSNAISLSYGLWIARYLWPPQMLEDSPGVHLWKTFLASYQQFWESPPLLLALALVVVCLALLSTHRSERALTEHPA